MKSGIYTIKAICGNEGKLGWVYLGQAIDIKQRFTRHLRDLRVNEHPNQKLQRYFNKYGENSLKFEILFHCEEILLDSWEIYCIELFNSIKLGFNIAKGGKAGGRYRKCRMQNMFTNEIVEFDSVKEFADFHKVNRSAASQVMVGKNNYVGDWFCPDNKWRPKKFNIINNKNEIFTITNVKLAKFFLEHTIDFNNMKNFRNMLEGKKKSALGWRLWRA